MPPDRSIITGGRAVDWITETCAPVPCTQLAQWADRQQAAEVALAGVDHEHLGLRLLQVARESRDSLGTIGAPEVITFAALLQAAVGQATLEEDEATAWAVIAADVLAAQDTST